LRRRSFAFKKKTHGDVGFFSGARVGDASVKPSERSDGRIPDFWKPGFGELICERK
jgi:hypothetical protein